MTSHSSGPSGSRKSLQFAHDSRGRRYSKAVSNWTGSAWVKVLDEKFLYDGWNLVAQLNATKNAVVRSYVWGSDLSGSLQGAGGVGGLLAVKDTANGTHFAAYDGNGNVVALVSATDASVSARYEYGPFGELLRGSGTLAKLNPFRFSTKFQDDETDQLYYGYRYLSTSMGRWLSRDPIEEAGGENLNGFVHNSPLGVVDPRGLAFLWDTFVGCVKSVGEKALDKYLDQLFACESLYKRMHGETPGKGETDVFDINFCKGFRFKPSFEPGYTPTSLAADIADCVLSGMKGRAIDEALKEITDPQQRKALKDLLEKGADYKPEAQFNLTVNAKCMNKKLQVNLDYSATVSAGGVSVSSTPKKVGPYGCPGWMQLDSECACCGSDGKKTK